MQVSWQDCPKYFSVYVTHGVPKQRYGRLGTHECFTPCHPSVLGVVGRCHPCSAPPDPRGPLGNNYLLNAPHPAKRQPWTAPPSQAANSTPHSPSPLQRVHKYTTPSTQPVKPCSTHKPAPYASRAFTTIPYTTEVTYPDHTFRILMLRRLRLPLPLTERACRCHRTLDPLGDHCGSCSQSGRGPQKQRGTT